MNIFTLLLIIIYFTNGKTEEYTDKKYEIDCNNLRMGQFLCPDPNHPEYKDRIDPKTQQLKGCTKENKAKSLYSNT